MIERGDARTPADRVTYGGWFPSDEAGLVRIDQGCVTRWVNPEVADRIFKARSLERIYVAQAAEEETDEHR